MTLEDHSQASGYASTEAALSWVPGVLQEQTDNTSSKGRDTGEAR